MRSSCRLILRDGCRTGSRRLGLEPLELAPRRGQLASKHLNPLPLLDERPSLLSRRSLGPRPFLGARPERLGILASCRQLPRKRVRAFMRSSCRLILRDGCRTGSRRLGLDPLPLLDERPSLLRRRSLGPRRFLGACPERLGLLASCRQLPRKRVHAFMRSSCRLILRDGCRTGSRHLGLEPLELGPRRGQVASKHLNPLPLLDERPPLLRRRSLGPRPFLGARPERLGILASCRQLPRKRVHAFMRSSCRLILRDGCRTGSRRLGLEPLELAPRRGQLASQRLDPLPLLDERPSLLRRRSLGPRRFLGACPERLGLLASCRQLPRKRVHAFMRSSCRLILRDGCRTGLRCLGLERLKLAARRGQLASQPLDPLPLLDERPSLLRRRSLDARRFLGGGPERLGLLASCRQLPRKRVRAFMRSSCRLILRDGCRTGSRRLGLEPLE